MKISLLHLITNQYIISEINELDEEPAVHMVRPYEIIENSSGYKLVRYPKFCEGENVLLHSERILTIGNPYPSIIKEYMDAIIMDDKSLKSSDE